MRTRTLGQMPEVDKTLVLRLVELLDRNDYPKLQFNAASLFADLSTEGTHEKIRQIVECGIIPMLLNLLKVQSEEIQEQVSDLSRYYFLFIGFVGLGKHFDRLC